MFLGPLEGVNKGAFREVIVKHPRRCLKNCALALLQGPLQTTWGPHCAPPTSSSTLTLRPQLQFGCYFIDPKHLNHVMVMGCTNILRADEFSIHPGAVSLLLKSRIAPFDSEFSHKKL